MTNLTEYAQGFMTGAAFAVLASGWAVILIAACWRAERRDRRLEQNPLPPATSL